jgi:hypothetical protein
MKQTVTMVSKVMWVSVMFKSVVWLIFVVIQVVEFRVMFVVRRRVSSMSVIVSSIPATKYLSRNTTK